ncbi:hypothetical protein [Flavobacterium urumqiense]|uniref:Uncharacterized protein n=1 Tax=Flavobacterium urumqiense TaxID=935224 RepID=A0A1H5UQK0_9FLAO|nr:hypothetical protein [Flavobacterium urumqiense]SEF77254.1 hypothetical protein SAMN04488130_102369 [Flavobacterium urumqiense]
MNKKLQQELKFKIGEQYGKYEFELDWVTSVVDNNLRYEVYRYIGKDKSSFFNFEIHKILLAYNCDFLTGVFYFIKGDCYSELIEKLNLKSNKRIKSDDFKNPVLLSITSNQRIIVIKNSENIMMLIVSYNEIQLETFFDINNLGLNIG